MLRKLKRKLSAVRLEKRRLHEGLLAHQAHLVPGVWILSEPAIARRAGHGPLPESLCATKGLGGARGGLVRRALRRLIYLGVPPLVVRLRREAGYDESSPLSNYSLLIVAKSGDVILMDSAHKKVLKVSNDSRTDAHQMAIRERLSRRLVLPDAQLFEGGKIVLEPFVQGQVFATLPTGDHKAVFTALLDQYVALTETDSTFATSDYWSNTVQMVRALPVPEVVHNKLERDGEALCARLKALAFTPAHGDLSGSNILQTNDGPILYDLEDCTLLPAFFDVFFLAHQEGQCGRTESWEQLTHPATWERMHAALDSSIDWQTWLWGMFLCEAAEWRNKVGGAKLTEPVLRDWWRLLSQVLDTEEIRANAHASATF